jgi:hypothetical protein
MFDSRIVKLPGVPMVTPRSGEHLYEKPPGSVKTYQAIREDFILDVATLHGRTLKQVAGIVAKMRKTVRLYPSEFTDAAHEFIDRIHAKAVAARLNGDLK